MSQYRTSDLPLATTLATHDFQLAGGGKEEGTDRIIFFFNENEILHKTVENYYARQTLVEPQMFFANLKMLKNLIHSHVKPRETKSGV